MPELLQHVVALTVVAACVGYIAWQGAQTLRGKRSRIGNCCSKGCDPTSSPTASTGKPKSPPLVYITIESPSRRRKE